MKIQPDKHWASQGGRNTPPKNTWKKDLEKEMLRAGFRYSWIKREATLSPAVPETCSQHFFFQIFFSGDKWSVDCFTKTGRQWAQVNRVTRTVNELCLGGAGRYHILSNQRISSKTVGKCAFHEEFRLHHTVASILRDVHTPVSRNKSVINQLI